MKGKEQESRLVDKAAAISALKTLEQSRTGIILTGHVKDGKVVIDQNCLDEVSRRFPSGHVSFVAVNAPFDPQSRSLSESAK